MGKMLEALKQAQGRHGPAAREAPALQAVWPDEAAEADPADEEEVPFVEVGGPREAKEPQAPMAAPSAPQAPARGPMAVQFHPLPAGPGAGPGACRFAAELVAYHHPQHAVSGQYRDLVGALLGALPAGENRVLLFTASAAGAGTTTVLLNAAITLAREGARRVAVVDAHLRRPALASRLGLAEAPGLRDVLAGRLPLEAALRPSGMPNLTALAAGTADAAPPVRLAGEGMRSLLRQLRERFDLVLVDGPPWDGRPEVVALGCACDAVCLCLPESDQHAPETADLLQVIPEQGAALCGCVLTSR